VDAVVVLLTGVLLVIIVIGIMNTMWIAIRERTREIGTLRAIGMQRGRVMSMFLFEASLLGLLGTGAGALAGLMIGLALNVLAVPLPAAAAEPMMSEHLSLSIHASSLITSMLSISMVCAVAALYPAYRATRLQPVTAMQQAGGIK
jgi:putative ABC transport system permease protein